jgi:hypothetical protein
VRYYDSQPWSGDEPQLVYPPRDFDRFPLYASHEWVGEDGLADIADEYDRVWLLISPADPAEDDAALRETLASTHRLVQTIERHQVTAELYERK